MRIKRLVSTLLCLTLILLFVPFLSTAADEKEVRIEVRKGNSHDELGEDDYQKVVYDLFDSQDIQVGVPSTSQAAVVYLQMWETYDLKAAFQDDPAYYASNMRLFVDEYLDGRVVRLYEKASLVNVPGSALELVPAQDGETGVVVQVRVDKDKLPAGFVPDSYRVLLIPRDEDESLWHVDQDGLPAGWEDSQTEDINSTRQEHAPLGNYSVFTSFYDEIEVNTDEGTFYDYDLIGFAVNDFTVDDPGDPGDPGSFDPESLIQVPNEAVVINRVLSGVEFRIDNDLLPDGFDPHCYKVMALNIADEWDISDGSFPPGYSEALPEPMDREIMMGLGPDLYKLFTAFLDSENELIGFNFMEIEVEQGGGPGDPGDPGDPGGPPIEPNMAFEFVAGEETESTEIGFDTGRPDYYVSCPLEGNVSIRFPESFEGQSLSFSKEFENWFLNDILDMSLTGQKRINYQSIVVDNEENLIEFGFPFERITLSCKLGDNSEEYLFTFFQPGYDEVEIEFELEGTDEAGNTVNDIHPVVFEQSNSHSGGDERAYVIPENLQSAILNYSAKTTNDVPVTETFAGIFEYLVDRSDLVSNNGNEFTVSRYFGKTELHIQYLIGYSWEGIIIGIYEPDYMGLEIRPQINAGPWQTGITNISGFNSTLRPTAYVYYVNEAVDIVPSSGGKSFSITGIDSDNTDVIAVHTDGVWTVELPDITMPVTTLVLTVETEENEVMTVPLDIKRVMVYAHTHDFTEQKPEQGEVFSGYTGLADEYIYKGYEDMLTWVSVDIHEDYPIDHTLLVMYYQGDRILGSRQIPLKLPVVIEDGGGTIFITNAEIMVYAEGTGEYADVAGADRITVFVVDDDGISTGDSAFGGTTFGLGAGWGHLLPNHPDWGTGKDGMDYEE